MRRQATCTNLSMFFFEGEVHVPLTRPRRKRRTTRDRRPKGKLISRLTDGGVGRRTVARAKLDGLVRERDAREERGQLIPKRDVDISLVREETLAHGRFTGLSLDLEICAEDHLAGGPIAAVEYSPGEISEQKGRKKGRGKEQPMTAPPPSKAHSPRSYHS